MTVLELLNVLGVDAGAEPEILLGEAMFDAEIVNASSDVSRSPVDAGPRTRL